MWALGKGKGCPVTCQAGTERKQKYSSTCTEPRRLMGVGGQHHAPAALPPGPMVQEAGGGDVVTGLDGSGKSRTHQGSNPGPSSPSESLYRLSYRGSYSP
jgi:hypothetical protein